DGQPALAVRGQIHRPADVHRRVAAAGGDRARSLVPARPPGDESRPDGRAQARIGGEGKLTAQDRHQAVAPVLWLRGALGVSVPRRLRADWRQEWEAELRYREELLVEWDRLDRRAKLALLWHSLGAFMDALWLQPKRWEDEMFQDLRFGARMLLKHKGFTI